MERQACHQSNRSKCYDHISKNSQNWYNEDMQDILPEFILRQHISSKIVHILY